MAAIVTAIVQGLWRSQVKNPFQLQAKTVFASQSVHLNKLPTGKLAWAYGRQFELNFNFYFWLSLKAEPQFLLYSSQIF